MVCSPATFGRWMFRRPHRIIALILVAIPLWVGCASDRAVSPAPVLVWPLPPEPPRIRYLQSIQDARDIGIRRTFFQKVVGFLFGPSRHPNLIRPMGVGVDRSGRLYVTDTGLQVVHQFDFAAKRYRQIFFLTPGGPDRLINPVGVAVDGRDRIYISDSDLNRIYVFDPDGNLQFVMGDEKTIGRVSGIAIDPEREVLYAVDTAGHRVVLFDLSGEKIGELGGRGTGPGEFNFPTFISADRAGRIYVADSLNFRIQIFNADGTFLRAFGRLGNTLGTFSRPKGVAVDGEGHVYVVDGLYDTVQIFDQEGRLLMHFGRSGREAGEFWLPNGIATDAQDRIYVADSYNRRVQVFQFQGGGPTPTEPRLEKITP